MTTLFDPLGIAHTAPPERTLRQSTIGNFDTCHRKVKYQYDPAVPYGTGSNRAFGTTYHAGLETYYKGGSWREMIDAATEAFTNEAGHIDDWGPDWESAPQCFEHALTLLETYLKLDPPAVDRTEWKVHAVEAEFYLPYDDTFFVKGAIDLVLEPVKPSPGKPRFLIDDHKTARRAWKKGKESPRNTNQPAWYQYWWAELWKRMTGEVLDPATDIGFRFDVMTLGGKFETRPATANWAAIKAVLLKAELALNLIEQDGPWLPNTQSFLCSSQYCDHWSICPFGEALERGQADLIPLSEVHA